MIKGKAVPKTDVTDWGFSYGVGWGGYPYGGYYGGSNVTVDQYDEGTLIVEVYDLKAKKMLWVGWVTGRVSTSTPSIASSWVPSSTASVSARTPRVGEWCTTRSRLMTRTLRAPPRSCQRLAWPWRHEGLTSQRSSRR